MATPTFCKARVLWSSYEGDPDILQSHSVLWRMVIRLMHRIAAIKAEKSITPWESWLLRIQSGLNVAVLESIKDTISLPLFLGQVHVVGEDNIDGIYTAKGR